MIRLLVARGFPLFYAKDASKIRRNVRENHSNEKRGEGEEEKNKNQLKNPHSSLTLGVTLASQSIVVREELRSTPGSCTLFSLRKKE